MCLGRGREWIAPFPELGSSPGRADLAGILSARSCKAALLAFPGSSRGITGRGVGWGAPPLACAAPCKKVGGSKGSWDPLPLFKQEELP